MSNPPRKTPPAGILAIRCIAEQEATCHESASCNTISFADLCEALSHITPGLGSLWMDYCTYLKAQQPRPDLN
jgi:hypothetical protein